MFGRPPTRQGGCGAVSEQQGGDGRREPEDSRRLPGATATIAISGGGPPHAVISVGPDGIVGARLVDRYVIEERIGAGGMGIVYAAHDLELQRPVAIKLVRPRVGDGAGRARLAREARTMASLRHANIATVFDIGTVDERIFIVMELVDGGTLASWLRDAPRSWREITGVFAQAAAGLAAAHAAGLVHRDFKPENVLVGRDGVVRVTDFGLARLVGEAGSGEVAERPTGPEPIAASAAVSGTPGYIAPEILQRRAYDARADQYSFCVALQRALSGPRASSGDGHGDRAAADAPPAAAADRAPRWLRRIVQRGLALDPALRWPSVDAMIGAIERRLQGPRRTAYAAAVLGLAALATSLVIARGARAPAGPVCRGAQDLLAGVWDDARKQTVQAALSVVGKSYATAAFTEAVRAFDRYAGEWVAMRTDACEATHVRGEQSQEVLDLRMECLDLWRKELDADVALLGAADAAVALRVPQIVAGLSNLRQCADISGLRAPVSVPGDPGVRARVHVLRGQLAKVRALQFAAKARDGLAIAVPVAAEARQLRYRPLEAEALYQLGLMQRLSGDLAAAHASLADAINAARAGRDARSEVLIAAALATLSASMAKLDDGQAWIARGLAAVEAMETRDPAVEATLLTSSAEVSLIQGKGEAALDYDRRALALRERIEPADSVTLAAMHVNLGRELDEVSRYPEALDELRRGLKIFEAQLGLQHPKIAWAAFQIAEVLGELGDHEQAVAGYRRSIAIYEATLGPESAELSLPLSNLAQSLKELGQYDEALACLARSIAVTCKAKGADHPHVGFAIMSIAEVLLASGRPGDAEPEAQRALAQFQRTVPAGHHSISRAMTVLGRVELELRQPVRALGLLEPALAMVSVRPDERPEVQLLLARALWDSARDRPRARALAEQARLGYLGLGHGHEKAVAEAETWLARHR
jgi:eukaryotic-like serine/threonine-protein kinase